MRLIQIGSIVVVAAIILIYALARTFTYAQGPTIRIFEPADGAGIASSSISIRGQAERVNSLSINGLPISMDTEGRFDEALTILPGINIVTLDATDQFKRSTRRELRLYGQSELPVQTADDAAFLHAVTSTSSTSTSSTTR